MPIQAECFECTRYNECGNKDKTMTFTEEEQRQYSRYTLSYWDEADDIKRAEILNEHQNRAYEGKEVWNKWANRFEEYIKNNSISDGYISFSNSSWEKYANFSSFIFPCSVSFYRAKFEGKFEGRYCAVFINAKFNGGSVYFNEAQFSGGSIYFSKAQFNGGPVDFDNAKFSGGTTYFIETQFSGGAVYFRGAQFSQGNVFFRKTQFIGGDVHFSEAQFSGLDVSFFGAKFTNNFWASKIYLNQDCSFNSAEFNQASNFSGIQFQQPPDFNYVTFKQAPYIAEMLIPWAVKTNQKNNIHIYRKLKQLAQDANDYEQELKYYGYETRCKLSLKETSILNKIIIWFYWQCSNFGQSLIRPLASFVIIFLLFFLPQISFIVVPELRASNTSIECKNNSSLHLKSALIRERLRYSFPFIPVDRKELNEINACLYKNPKAIPLKSKLINGLQFIFSSGCFFLFGLGLRNRFKIK